MPSFVDFYVLMEPKTLTLVQLDVRISAFMPARFGYDTSSGNVSDKVDEDNTGVLICPGSVSARVVPTAFGCALAGDILMSCERFYSMVRERYLELQPYIVNLYEDNRLGQNQIDKLVAENRAAIERNNEMWPMDVAYSIYEMKPLPTYEENVMHYRDWLRRRNDFLLSYFG